MAVPKERVIIRLKAYANKANLSNTRIDAFADKLCLLPADDADDAAIDAVITNADAIFSFKEIAAQDDKMVSLETKLKTPPPTPPPTDPPTPPTPPTPGNEIPAWAQALIDGNKKLEEKLSVIETGKVIESKKSLAAQVFEKSEVLKVLKPEIKQSWLNRLNVDSEVPIEEQITGLETEYKTMAQAFADSSSFSGPAPLGNPDIKPDQKLIDSVYDSM